MEGGNLKSGYYVRPPLPENKRAVLRYLMANRGATMSQCSKHLDVLADKAIYDMAAIGYIEGDGRFLNQCRLFVTGKGRDAYNRQHQKNAAMEIKYEPYVPEKHAFVRQGAEDALRLKSKGAN